MRDSAVIKSVRGARQGSFPSLVRDARIEPECKARAKHILNNNPQGRYCWVCVGIFCWCLMEPRLVVDGLLQNSI